MLRTALDRINSRTAATELPSRTGASRGVRKYIACSISLTLSARWMRWIESPEHQRILGLDTLASILEALDMRVLHLLAAASISTAGAVPPGGQHCLGHKCAPESDALTAHGLKNLKAYVAEKGYTNTTCTLEKAAVRKEWYVLD